MKRFEYKVIAIATVVTLTTKQYEMTAQTFEEELNQLGAEGWELVQRADGFFFLKREVEDAVSPEALEDIESEVQEEGLHL